MNRRTSSGRCGRRRPTSRKRLLLLRPTTTHGSNTHVTQTWYFTSSETYHLTCPFFVLIFICSSSLPSTFLRFHPLPSVGRASFARLLACLHLVSTDAIRLLLSPPHSTPQSDELNGRQEAPPARNMGPRPVAPSAQVLPSECVSPYINL